MSTSHRTVPVLTSLAETVPPAPSRPIPLAHPATVPPKHDGSRCSPKRALCVTVVAAAIAATVALFIDPPPGHLFERMEPRTALERLIDNVPLEADKRSTLKVLLSHPSAMNWRSPSAGGPIVVCSKLSYAEIGRLMKVTPREAVDRVAAVESDGWVDTKVRWPRSSGRVAGLRKNALNIFTIRVPPAFLPAAAAQHEAPPVVDDHPPRSQAGEPDPELEGDPSEAPGLEPDDDVDPGAGPDVAAGNPGPDAPVVDGELGAGEASEDADAKLLDEGRAELAALASSMSAEARQKALAEAAAEREAARRAEEEEHRANAEALRLAALKEDEEVATRVGASREPQRRVQVTLQGGGGTTWKPAWLLAQEARSAQKSERAAARSSSSCLPAARKEEIERAAVCEILDLYKGALRRYTPEFPGLVLIQRTAARHSLVKALMGLEQGLIQLPTEEPRKPLSFLLRCVGVVDDRREPSKAAKRAAHRAQETIDAEEEALRAADEERRRATRDALPAGDPRRGPNSTGPPKRPT